MGMSATSSPMALNGPALVSGEGKQLAKGMANLGLESDLGQPWDLPVPTRSAPQPPTPGGTQSGWERGETTLDASPGGTRNHSASSSPNPNRFSASFGRASGQDISAGMGRGVANGGPAALSVHPPPPRPSRAGTMPLLDTHGAMSAVNNGPPSAGPFNISSPTATTGTAQHSLSPHSGQTHSAGLTSPQYLRSPASATPLMGAAAGITPHLPPPPPPAAPLQPPQFIHQPYSAPGNPYQTVSHDQELGSDEKDLPDKPKGRERSGTKSSTKEGKKSVFGFMTDLLNTNKPVVISAPYDPVHLTHVGFNSDTGEFTGLPKEWQQTLQANGVTREEQEKNPQAVMDIMKFYGDNMANGHSIQEGVFDKMKNAAGSERSSGEGDKESPNAQVSLTQAAEIARSQGADTAFIAKYAHPRAAPPPPPPTNKKAGVPKPPGQMVSAVPPPPGPPKQSRVQNAIPLAPAPLDRSLSQRSVPTQPSYKPIDRSLSQRRPDPRQAPAPPPQQQPFSKPSLQSSHPSRGPANSPATSALSRNASKATPGTATPRRREKPKESFDVIAKLKAICTDADPTKLYRSLVKIGQG